MQSPDYKPNRQEIIKACDRQIADLEGKMRHRNSPYKLLQIKREIKELQEIKRNCMMSLAVFGETTEPAETTCDICGKKIVGIENFVNAGDKVVCSEKCRQTAEAEFTHWQNTGIKK